MVFRNLLFRVSTINIQCFIILFKQYINKCNKAFKGMLTGGYKKGNVEVPERVD